MFSPFFFVRAENHNHPKPEKFLMKRKKWVHSLLTGVLFALPVIGLAQGMVPDTVKICALRVEFKPDNNELTSGDGTFADTVTTDINAVDPAPHDRQYFQDQLTAAANYFKAVSGGRLVVTGDVFPREAKAAFRLQKTMGSYNPNTTDEEINRGISRLFVDAVRAADASNEGIDFGQYDLVVVFHAGVGRDVELGYDPTPQDIPSLYLNEAFLKKALGDTFGGIAVHGGVIRSGILLPETENQEGHAIALTGFLVSNIGSYLGLYDLFSPSNKRSGVGRFGLMDAGLLNLNGLVPAPPSAFSRMLLGWDNPVTVTQPQKDIEVARLFSQNALTGTTLYKIPMNADEYYLVECRGVPDVNIDSLYLELATNRDKLPTYVELLRKYFPDQIEFGPSGVLTKVANYDLGLPGNGILIWHVDERIIREKGPENKINDDPAQRGVAVVEADAAQDIGQNYSLLDAGYQTELGWFADFWFKNRPPYIKNFELYTNEFSSVSHPATLSNRDHAYTHVKLYDFSDNTGDVMRFSFTREMSEPGFPLNLEHANKITRWFAFRNAATSTTCFYLGDQSGNVFAVKRDAATGQPVTYPVWQDTSAIKQLTLIAGDGFYKLAVAGTNTIVVVPYDYDFRSGNATSALRWQAPAAIVAGPVSYGDKMYVACANDSLYAFQVSEHALTLLARQTGFAHFRDLAMLSAGIPAEINALGNVMALGVSEDAGSGGRFFALSREDGHAVMHVLPSEQSQPFVLPQSPVGAFALANLTEGAIPEIVFNAKDKIYAYNFNGTPVTQFPLVPTLARGDSLVGTPLLADLSGNGQTDVVTVSSQGVVLAVDLNGRPLKNFPLSAGGSVTLSPVLLQWDDDAAAELAVVTQDGQVFMWNVEGSSAQALYWPQANLDGTNNKIFAVYPPGKSEPVAGGDILPANKVYNYPNPNQGDFTTIRFYLTQKAEVTVRVFDLAGKQIADFNVSGKAMTDNEVVWNVRDVASGVYLCQVEARAGGKTQRRLFKIMVVH